MTQTPVRPAARRTRSDDRPRRHLERPDHRQRFRRARRGDPADQGRPRRLPRHRARQRGRRHLARQHLPGRRLRRALAPVLVLLRAQPELVALVLPAARDPGLPARRRGQVRRRRQAPVRHRGHPRPVGRRPPAAGSSTPPTATSAPTSSSARSARCASRTCPTSRASRTSEGEIFHSARWNHDADLAGKRVALIGTGASAIQIGPAIADDASGTSTSTSAPPRG